MEGERERERESNGRRKSELRVLDCWRVERQVRGVGGGCRAAEKRRRMQTKTEISLPAGCERSVEEGCKRRWRRQLTVEEGERGLKEVVVWAGERERERERERVEGGGSGG